MDSKVIFLIGPSGVGKTSVRKTLLDLNKNLVFIPSYTTREPRLSEMNGTDYHFITKYEFQQRLNKSEFIEWEEHFGNFYGIKECDYIDVLAKGYSIIKEIAFNGFKDFKQKTSIPHYNIVSIFIYPSQDIKALHKRLETRGDKDINFRVKSANLELANMGLCDYQVCSTEGNLNRLIIEIKNILELDYNIQ